MALPLGELSPKVTERALPPCVPFPSSLRSATSPIGRGKGCSHSMIHYTITGTADYPAVPVDRLIRPACCGGIFNNIGITFRA